jgi:hypothetical protein
LEVKIICKNNVIVIVQGDSPEDGYVM